VGLGLLYLFHPVFGIVPVPFFFDAVSRWASPVTDPWSWLRTLLVPWLVLAAPLAGMCLRMTLGQAREIAEEAGVRQLLLFHHDPHHTDAQIDAILEEQRAACRPGLSVAAAYEGMELRKGERS